MCRLERGELQPWSCLDAEEKGPGTHCWRMLRWLGYYSKLLHFTNPYMDPRYHSTLALQTIIYVHAQAAVGHKWQR